MANFDRRTPPQKPIVINAPITNREFKKRDGSTGNCGVFSFQDGNNNYTIQIQKVSDGKTTRKGKIITGWAQVAKFSQNGGNGGW